MSSPASWSDMGLGAGQSAGVARGRIVIDTTSFETARVNVVRASADMTKSIQQTDAQTKQLTTSTQAFGSAAGLAWGSFLGYSLKSADNVRSLERLMTTFIGDTQKAAQVMGELRAQADRTNTPFLGLLNSSRQILPALRGQVDALDEATIIAQKLAIIDPAQGFEGAGLAIREFLSGTYTSLVNRFELSRSELMRIRDQYKGDTEGMLRELNRFLTESTNITDDSLAEMGDTGTAAFAQMRDELTLLLADGFEPLLTEGVIPVLRGLTDLFQEAREGYPELVKIASIMAAIAASGAVLGKGIPLLGIGGIGGAAQAGVYGAAAYGGATIGVEAVNEIGRQTGDERLENYELGDALTTAKQGLFLLANALIEGHELIFEGANLLFTSFERGGAELEFVADSLYDTVDVVFEGIQDSVKLGVLSIQQFLANISIKDPTGKVIDVEFDELLGLDKNAIAREIESLKNSSNLMGELTGRLENNRDAYDDALAGIEESARRRGEDIEDASRELQIKIGEGLGVIEESERVLVGFWNGLAENINRLMQAVETPDDFSQEQIDAWMEFQDRIAEIDAEAQAEALEAQADHDKELLALQADHDQQEIDLAQAHADQLTALDKKRNDGIQDAADKRTKTETESLTRLNTKIADLRRDAARNEEEIQISLAERLQRIWFSLQDNLEDAAAKLSGQGIFDANKADARAKRDAGLDSNQERARIQRRLEQQIEDEQRAHEVRLQQSADAETERLAQIQAGYDEEYTALLTKQENERNALAAAQADELTQLQANLDERLATIQANAEKQKQAEEKAFIKTFNALATAAGQHQNRMIGIQRQGQQIAENELRAWWTRQQQLFRNTTVANNRVVPGRTGGPQNYSADFVAGIRDAGGSIRNEGLYQLAPGEYVLDPAQTAFMMRSVNNDLSLANLQTAFGRGGSNDGGLKIDRVEVNNHFPQESNQWSHEQMAAFVEDESLKAFNKVLKGYGGAG